MLKALELVGFKSFADKTRFEFPPGITVVVGPNGSGKSNIVDAIKWVLGEQSVKSLRGKEMADVIFNGSGSRRPLNSAETVLTFDNTDNILPIDTPEVHVARRVYRSGEGEYLINGQACRLRDVRDLFSGTGVSTQAYSIIEQGKVDVMLQASPRDRRLIFEEAAGISRFKAKKLEAIRRLDRVEQNLLRLSDIVDEVDNRLRSVRKQAGKAQRYREYTNRLQDLRTQVGLTDWRHLSETLTAHEQKLDTLKTEVVQSSASAETLDTRALELETEVATLDESLRASDRDAAGNRERIASCESTIEHQRNRTADLDQEIARRKNQLAAMTSRTRDLGSQLQATTQDVADAERQNKQVLDRVAALDEALSSVTATFERLRRDIDQGRTDHMELVRQSAQLGNEITSLETRLQAETDALARCRQQLGALETTRGKRAAELAELVYKEAEQNRQLADCQTDWQAAKEEFAARQEELTSRQHELARKREVRSGMTERATVLEELEKQLEGLSSGVKQVLIEARQLPDGPFQQVRGLVADILEVQVDMAPLIETALGERAGYLVVGPSRALRLLLESDRHRFQGRVGFVPVELPGRAPGTAIDLSARPGVAGRADTFVQTEPQYARFAERLLGETWIVDRLSDALELAPTAAGQNFVTRKGQWLGADGTLCVGPKSNATGLISRRSELRDLRQRIAALAAEIHDDEGVLERLAEGVADANARIETIGADREALQKSVAESRRDVSAAEQRQAQLDEQHESLTTELNRARAARDAATSDLALLRDRRQDNETRLEKLEGLVQRDQKQLEDVEKQRQQHTADVTTAKVELARSEQLLDSLSTRLRQFELDHQERQRSIDESRAHLVDAQENASGCENKILELESDVAVLYLCKEDLAKASLELVETREQLRQQRGQILVDVQKLRAKVRKCETQLHAEELAAGDVRHERDSLAARMREDYNIELAELEHEPTEEEQLEREAIEEEISDLRRKLNNIGNVNLDALEELEGLETRFEELSAQFTDLTKAKASLEHIIEKINVDSRRLFSETLETVRGHFQGLFRKLFGGGQADIIMDDDADILESGLEIVARPPGKEPRSISLLSGGEKTLTCVALLLAIFRSRPSPFCVLDEVDAALDEANIERFIGVLKEFLQWTQFIVVTHSKKTMSGAGTLYGVTMQESGISKRVSVRFEDVSETGEILSTADDDDETQAA